jgi:hypothetical protein
VREGGKGGGRTRKGGRRRGRESERDKHFPICSTQQDRRADWNSEWKVGGGGGVVNERGEGGKERSDSDVPARIPPTGEIFFHSVPVLSEIFLVRDFFSFPIFYLVRPRTKKMHLRVLGGGDVVKHS